MPRRVVLRLAWSVLPAVTLALVYPALEARNALPALRVAVEPLAPAKNLRVLQRVVAALCGQQPLQLSTLSRRGRWASAALGRADADSAFARTLALGGRDDVLAELWAVANALHSSLDGAAPRQQGQPQLEDYVRHALQRRWERRVVLPQPKISATESSAASVPESGSRASSSALPAGVMDELRAAAPREWLPAKGCEPLAPPYQRFCQGPRRVAAPFGPAHEAAKRLELGTRKTVHRLLSSEPRKDWVIAAGGPSTPHAELSWPVPSGNLWRRFGYVRRPPFEHLLHRGIDVGAPHGTPIRAAESGIVAYSDNRVRGYGNLLVIVHADASVTFSAHCRAIYVFAGQHVQRDQIVAEVGDTGLARGAHVHWEYLVRGRPVDPERLFAGARRS